MMRYQIVRNWLTRQWHWKLISIDDEIIAISGGSYKSKADCVHAIDLVRASLMSPIRGW